MANHAKRVFSFTLAVLFFLSAMSITGFYLWNFFQEDKDSTSEVADPTQEQNTEENVQDLAKMENFDPPVEVKELRWDITKEGDGAVVKEGDTISFTYTGAFAKNGIIFDSSSEPITYPLDNLIKGWQEGIPGMKVGETRRLFIPADLGYGAETDDYSYTQKGDPVLGDLVFDLTLTGVE